MPTGDSSGEPPAEDAGTSVPLPSLVSLTLLNGDGATELTAVQ